MSQSGAALLATNAILITAFASFPTASFMPHVLFGLLTAFTLAVALLADALLLPALLLLGARDARVEAAPLPAAALPSVSEGLKNELDPSRDVGGCQRGG